MGYHSYCEISGHITKVTLPPEITSKIMDNETVIKELRAGKDAFDPSIKKWNALKCAINYIFNKPFPYAFMEDLLSWIGYRNCALCLKALEKIKHIKFEKQTNSNKCTACRFAAFNRCTKKNSTYYLFESYLGSLLKKIENFDLLKKSEIMKDYNFLLTQANQMIEDLKNARAKTPDSFSKI